MGAASKSDERALTAGEQALARSVYRGAIDLAAVRIVRRKWWWLQPRAVVMAPCGAIHFHPGGTAWRADFSAEGPGLRGLYVHELCHVWQHQQGIFLPLARHPFCRYRYTLRPGRPLGRYGIEQQAEIVRRAYLMREGAIPADAAERAAHEALLSAFD